jgi:nitrate/nitrite transport system ATP-binding protein
MAFLEVRNLCKGYGTKDGRTEVLSGIDLSIRQGEFVAVVGYSGAGKTTLMSCLAGLLLPDAGSVTLNGEPVKGPGPDRAVVFQNYSLLPWLTVFDNVALAVEQVFPKMTRGERYAHVMHYLEMVNLKPAIHKTPAELSGGMRQRVSVARALAMKPQVLLMDEPFSALDALTRATLQDELVRIFSTDKTTVVMITNDVDEGILVADRIVPLSMGPRATLGPEVAVDIARPRDRKAINHCPEFKRIRRSVFDYLLGPGRKGGAVPAQSTEPPQANVVLPELKPVDLSSKRRAPRVVLEATAA